MTATPRRNSDHPRSERPVALVDSGIGLVSYADALHGARPDLPLVLSLDPDNMPYGPRPPEQVRELILAGARRTLPYDPQAIVVACNTASVHGLEALRAELEPEIPVIGTVPAIRPAAAAGGPVAVWATAATTSSAYLRGLIDAFAADLDVTPVACLGLAEAIESGDLARVDAAIVDAAQLTPAGTRALVLGCTHYGLVADRIAAAVGPVQIFDSPDAVARQALRRIGLAPDASAPPGPGIVTVLRSGRTGHLPDWLVQFPSGARVLDLTN